MGLSKEIILTVKDYEIKLNRDIKFYENDTIDLCFSILEYGIEVKDGVAVNKLMPINALKAYMLIETPQGVDYAESTKVENNRVVFNLGNKYSQFIGIGRMQIVIKDNDGCRITLPEFPFEIRQSINSDWDRDITVLSTEASEIIVDEFGREVALKKISEMEEENTLPIDSYSMILDNNKNKKIKTNLITQKIENDLQLVNEQLETKVSFKVPTATNMAWAWFEASTPSDVYGGAVVKVSIREKAHSRGVEIYNQSGVTDGTQTPLDKAMESFVIHHYNDNNVIQLDNVGRRNSILILKNARNNLMSGHNETGSGDYIRFLRDDETEGIQYLGAIAPVNWKDKNITGIDKWGLQIKNRTKDLNTTTPILMTSEGSSTKQGEQALYLYSLAYGGSCLKMTNMVNSKGFNLHIVANSKELNSGGILIENSGSTASIDILNQNRQVPMIRFRRTSAVYDDLIYAINESNRPLFRITGNGKSIFITDSGDNTLKEVKVINGVLTVV